MSETVIRVENLSKQYRIGVKERYGCLRDSLVQGLTAPFRRLRRFGQKPSPDEMIWALKDVSLEVQQGEVVGIIGRNGAGKSTLLKVLSRITEPTEGEVRIRGRVASLLEVGTGFHPELTGRENIFLNGAILGMSRKEIECKFDDIVAFSEIEKLIDTPVKRYSSGMYVRLAFSVAAHLESEILLVDEVLAVGDAAFQKKCLGNMGEVAKGGRTVLFVSHNMGAVRGLCKRAIWLDNGQLRMDGIVADSIAAYLTASSFIDQGVNVEQMPRVTGGRDIRLTRLELLNGSAQPTRHFRYGDAMIMRFYFRVLNTGHRYFAIEWVISTLTGDRVLYASSSPQGAVLIKPTDSSGCIECRIPHLPLAVGTYRVNCLLSLPHQERIDEVEGAATFEVLTCDVCGTGFNVDHRLAFVTTCTHWSVFSGAKSLFDDHEDPFGP
ncbi:MAG: ABC transporter ATP-binding protein [bacterium]|nr:ABC transporter ATP-binding protein [bacterium]